MSYTPGPVPLDKENLQAYLEYELGQISIALQDEPVPEILGSRGGNVALANLLTKLEALGWIKDSTT